MVHSKMYSLLFSGPFGLFIIYMEENIETIETPVDATETQGRVYELAYLFVPTLDVDASMERFVQLKSYLQDKGAEVISEDTPKLIELQYEMSRTIQNKKTWFDEGYFGWVKFALEPDAVKAIHDELERDETIIRFMIIKTVRENTISAKKSFGYRARKDDSSTDEKIDAPEEVKEAEHIVEADVDRAVDALVTEA